VLLFRAEAKEQYKPPEIWVYYCELPRPLVHRGPSSPCAIFQRLSRAIALFRDLWQARLIKGRCPASVGPTPTTFSLGTAYYTSMLHKIERMVKFGTYQTWDLAGLLFRIDRL
jgi:hypothetical protein